MEVKNRIFLASMGTRLATDKNEITEKVIDHYAARARGGAGFITTECTIVDEFCKYGTYKNLGLYKDSQIDGWRKLADEVHKYGAKLAPQLFHSATAASAVYNDNIRPIAASPIPARIPNEIPRTLTIEEIPSYVEKFGEAARRAKEAGCDAIELHCAHRHGLLANFLSPLHNKRIDAYGGNIDGRLKLPLEVIAKVIEKTGQDFPIIVRLSATEMEPGGLSLLETCYIAKRMEEAGVSMFHISNGCFDNHWNQLAPSGSGKAINSELSEKIKHVVNVPVGVVGRVNEPWTAEMVLALGRADVTYMARALLCDPEFPNKAREGKCGDIRPCIGCLGCITTTSRDMDIRCAMNAFVGETTKPLTKAEKSKRILVVGGGPAGLEAARVASLRGHDVTLMEKSDRLGGQGYLAAFPPKKQDIAGGMKYLVEQAEKSGVKFKLNTNVSPETIKAFSPDAIILATGGKPIMPKWLTNHQGNIVSAWDVLEGKCATGVNILVVGGSLVGCETANFLVHPYNDRSVFGKKVTIIEMQNNILLEERSNIRSTLVRQLQEKGVHIITSAKVEEVFPDGVGYTRFGEKEVLKGFNTIVAALGTQSENALAEELLKLGIPTQIIGDANSPRKLMDAISEGAAAAQKL